MNVFVVPSWYPHRCFPLEGVYVRDLVLATGELRPNWRMAISLWGQGRSEFSLRHAFRSPICICESLVDRAPRTVDLSTNVRTYYTPAISATARLRSWTARGLLEANRRSFLRARSREGGIDLIHAHVSYPGGWIALQLHKEFGLPYVITEHMAPFPVPSYTTRDGRLASYLREPLDHAAAVIAVSQPLAERIAGFGIQSPVVIPNLIDERPYRVGTRPERSEFVFFTVCGMEKRKGIDELLRAAAAFLPDLPSNERQHVRFRMGGAGPDLESFRRHAKRLGIDPSVEWLGFLSRDRTRQEFENCDCFVLASRQESFGIVFLEAMAAGRPAIGTACGGPESLITPETGLIVPVGNAALLAEALRQVYTNIGRYDPSTIRASFDRRFHRSGIVDQLERIYRQSTDAPRAKRDRE